MEHGTKTYIALIIIFSLAIFSSWLIPTNQLLKGIFASPAVLALIGALYQVLRDQAAFEKQKYFDDRKRVFDIGATSHMANTAFDKHVEFCEEYMQEVHCTVGTLFREGPSGKVLENVNKTSSLRQKYAAWLTDEINTNLEPYEQAVREIGAWSGFVNSTIGDPHNSVKRSKKIDDMWQKFNEVLGLDGTEKAEEVYAIESVKKRVREILGVEELTHIRMHLIKEAVSALET